MQSQEYNKQTYIHEGNQKRLNTTITIHPNTIHHIDYYHPNDYSLLRFPIYHTIVMIKRMYLTFLWSKFQPYHTRIESNPPLIIFRNQTPTNHPEEIRERVSLNEQSSKGKKGNHNKLNKTIAIHPILFII